MNVQDNFFIKKNKVILPVNTNKYLLQLLSPTKVGTKYWSSPPSSEISGRQLGRMLLQVHQILDLYKSLSISLDNKSFIDIGTGNGMIPRLLLQLSGLSKAIGSDPFLDGEHSTSWQKHNHNQALLAITEFINSNFNNYLEFKNYNFLTEHESFSFEPQNIDIIRTKEKYYKSVKLGIHNINEINQKFDLIYCKAIEHISDWENAFASVSKIAKKDSFFYLKHRSFFSYLGSHRYASIGIPWGHLLLSENEYKSFVKKFHFDRATEMNKFYFNDLTYPRKSVSDMIKIANKYNFQLHGIKIEPPKYKDIVFNFINDIENFWNIIGENFPKISSEEVFSGIYHIIFKKA